MLRNCLILAFASTCLAVENTVPPKIECCDSMQDQYDELLAQMNALQDTVDGLQQQVDNIERELNYTNAKESCDQYKAVGMRSGRFLIDPDGVEGILAPFEVYCDMDSDPQFAVTLLGHDSEKTTLVSGCQDPGCYSHDVVYDDLWDQIESVMWRAESCRQYLSYQCRGSMLFSYNVYAWWVSSDGQNQYYWPGADPGSEMCACGKNGTCDGDSVTCNCDNNDDVWRQDDGYLESKFLLPVKQLNFGDVLGVEESGLFTLGKLECKGKVSTTDCKGLKLAGNPSGYYKIAPDPLTEPFTVYCDMNSYPETGVTVIHHDDEGQSSKLYYSTDNDIDITYINATMDQITSLIEISDSCQQYIEWQCYRTGMLYGGYTWWISRQGDKMTYWGGADPNHSGYCACGESGTCNTGNTWNWKCNCDDTASNVWRVDAGNLYDKNTLPVTGMHFGFYSSSSSYGGYYTLGPLRCY